MVTALVSGFTAKEAVVSTFGVILGVGTEHLTAALHSIFTVESVNVMSLLFSNILLITLAATGAHEPFSIIPTVLF